MDLAFARSFALALPGAYEAPHHGIASWRVEGKIFASVPAQGDVLHVFLDASDARDLATGAPAAFEELRWGTKLLGVKVRLAATPDERVEALLEQAWRRKAPRRLVTAFDAATGERG